MIQLKLLAGFAVRRSRFSSQAQIERLCMRNLLASTEERVFFKDLDSRFVLLSAGVLKVRGAVPIARRGARKDGRRLL
jgi:hypothetical protein